MRHALLLLFALVFSATGLLQVCAQALYVGSEQVVTIRPDTRVVICGNLLNRGSLINQGTLRISGNWHNEATYTDAPGSEVVLAGARQTINHPGQSFHHLSVRGSGTKELRSTVRVTDTLTLNAGVLQSSKTASLTLEPTATVVGGSSESFVESTMVYQGSGERHFPLGLAGAYLPLTLTDVMGEAPSLRVSVVAPNPVGSLDASLARVSSAHYWRIETVGGTFTGSPVELTVNQSDGLEELLGAVVARSADPGGQFVSAGQSDRSGDAVQGTITSEDQIEQSIVSVGVTSLFSVENQVLVPSAFAPDAPNPTNRSVKIYASTLLPESFLFRIFDRWGNLVYQTASLSQAREQGWEGARRSDRSPVPAGVYQYHLRGLFENGTPVDQSGTITLFR
ncbi:MAG: gliding motility-associated C-terminal domain-containing protein [Tunicatimonas sp.]